ncbi:MAG: uridine phosphorylase [Lentisphaerae bacterium RIFOXYB12_FULL_60_10]|nr:MAG: uridine phosphorylase [Lentisphaerae bacterium RIFOXYB12_FULL_60_10]
MIPLLANKHCNRPSVFDPVNLLREARRQKSIPEGNVPDICVLDPDGDLFRHLRDSGARRNSYWACFHTELYDLDLDGTTVGVLGCAVGASFAVLVAEELFASGCRFLVSVTSAGQIVPTRKPPYFVLIDRALRDEGTSYHYLPPTAYALIQPKALAIAQSVLTTSADMVQGGAWTTDAPFRETEEAIAFARSENLLAVEMEAAALYALAEAKGYPMVCFARVTNQMGMIENDFEKGEADGNTAFVSLISRMAQAWRVRP